MPHRDYWKLQSIHQKQLLHTLRKKKKQEHWLSRNKSKPFGQWRNAEYKFYILFWTTDLQSEFFLISGLVLVDLHWFIYVSDLKMICDILVLSCGLGQGLKIKNQGGVHCGTVVRPWYETAISHKRVVVQNLVDLGSSTLLILLESKSWRSRSHVPAIQVGNSNEILIVSLAHSWLL